MPADGPSKCFGYVQTYDRKPKRRLFEVLKSQGVQMNQQVTFLTDCGDDVRDLSLYVDPQAGHLLDWFHITMRLTVMRQTAKGLRPRDNSKLADEVAEDRERLKWPLWHGNVFGAGAHLLLQVRTKVLNGELDDLFRAWCPGFRPRSVEVRAAAA